MRQGLCAGVSSMSTRCSANSYAFHPTAAACLGTVAIMILACTVGVGQQTVNRSRRFGPDACGPVDPSYIRLANETGGQPMFLQPSEAAKAVQFMRESNGSNRVILLWASDTLSSGSREYKVPIDSTVQRVTFSLSTNTKGTSMAVLSPGGETIAAGGTGVEITELNCGRVVTVNAPQAGQWGVILSGAGTFWLEAQGKSDISLDTVQFVRPGGRPGHEGLFRIPGQPLSGEQATLEVVLSGAVETAQFDLVRLGGERIKTLDMRLESPGDDDEQYVGTLDLPSDPFRVAVTGREAGGNTYQRYYATLFHAEPVEVLPPHVMDDLKPGTSTTLAYKVRNVGPPSTFRIMAVDTRHFVTRVEPSALTLETGASERVNIDLTLPPETQSGVGLDLTVTATSISDPASSNGSSTHLSVYSGQNP